MPLSINSLPEKLNLYLIKPLHCFIGNMERTLSSNTTGYKQANSQCGKVYRTRKKFIPTNKLQEEKKGMEGKPIA